MNYTPEKLEDITFSKSILNGYRKDQVDNEISKILEDYKQSINEINELKERNIKLNETIKRYKSIEEAMQQCLVIAQQTSDNIKMSASEKAKSIIEDAEAASQKIIGDANLEANKIKLEYENAKNSVYSFRAKSEALLQAQLDVLKQLSDE